jgi:hypothetical protein
MIEFSVPERPGVPPTPRPPDPSVPPPGPERPPAEPDPAPPAPDLPLPDPAEDPQPVLTTRRWSRRSCSAR